MFTGIIEESGIVTSTRLRSGFTRLTIQADTILKELKAGDSIAVNGICVTAVEIQPGRFTADISPETLARTNLSTIQKNSYVNLERAMQVNDRFGGHIVTGHIDGTADILSRIEEGNSIIYIFKLIDKFMKYIAPKGSVAVDGISLTVAECSGTSFKVSIIPFTQKHTTLQYKKPGDQVNIECDIISKYVERLLHYSQDKKKIQMTTNFLKETGFF